MASFPGSFFFLSLSLSLSCLLSRARKIPFFLYIAENVSLPNRFSFVENIKKMVLMFLTQTDKTTGFFWCPVVVGFLLRLGSKRLIWCRRRWHTIVLVRHLLSVVQMTDMSRLAHSVHSTSRSRINRMDSKDFGIRIGNKKTSQKYITLTILIPEWLQKTYPKSALKLYDKNSCSRGVVIGTSEMIPLNLKNYCNDWAFKTNENNKEICACFSSICLSILLQISFCVFTIFAWPLKAVK